MNAEVRGRGRKWDVFYCDEGGIATTFLVYDKDCVVVRTIEAGAPSKGFVKAYGSPFETQAEAEEYARWLGATEVKVVRTRAQPPQLAAAASRKTAVPA